MSVQEYALQIDQGRDFLASWCWIAGGVGVDYTNASFSFLARQLPQDTPVLALPASYGLISVLAPVTVLLNGTYWGVLYENIPVQVTPLQLYLSATATALLTLQRYRYALTVTWADATSTNFLTGDIRVEAT